MTPPWLLFFPKPAPYEFQRPAMEVIYNAISQGRPVLLEAPCGTGKTLSALAPALAVAADRKKRVIIATSVRQQTEQFIQEGRAIKAKAGINVAVLHGKKTMCPLLGDDYDRDMCDVLSEATHDLNKGIAKAQEEGGVETAVAVATLREILSDAGSRRTNDKTRKKLAGILGTSTSILPKYCPYLLNALLADQDVFRAWYYSDVRHPHDVMNKAQAEGLCAYEMVKRSLGEAQLVICNYEHILDDNILGHILRWLGGRDDTALNLDDVILVFDEAHNLEAKAREHASFDLSQYTVDKAMEELENEGAKVGTINDGMREARSEAEDLLTPVKAYFDAKTEAITADDRKQHNEKVERLRRSDGDSFIDALGLPRDVLKKKAEAALQLGRGIIALKIATMGKKKAYSRILSVARFVLGYIETDGDPKYYPRARLDYEDGVSAPIVEVKCCIPTDITKPIMDSAYGVALISATLQPFETECAALGIGDKAETKAYPSSFPPERRLTIATGTNRITAKTRELKRVIGEVDSIIAAAVDATPGNVMVVCTTMDEARKYHDLFDDAVAGVAKYLDTSDNTEDIKREFFEVGTGHSKAVLFTYMWGKLTEGIDFKDDLLRTVVVVGVPLRRMDDEYEAVRDAYETIYHVDGFDYAAFFPAMRRVRQTCGRVVRSPADFGACILIDQRYFNGNAKRGFTDEERAEIRHVDPVNVKETLEEFFKGINQAEDGKTTASAPIT